MCDVTEYFCWTNINNILSPLYVSDFLVGTVEGWGGHIGAVFWGNNMLTPRFVLLTNNTGDARDQVFKLYICLLCTEIG